MESGGQNSQQSGEQTGEQSTGSGTGQHESDGPHRADQSALDARVQEYYSGRSGWDEHARLTSRSAQGPLEHIRTQELIRQRLAPGARVLDVGGATGVHAAPLAADGYDVLLVDPVAGQVARAAEHGTFEARVGDARDLSAAGLDLGDDEFDAVLLLGPLYHLATREERLLALREAARVTRPGGTVAAAGITRLAALVGGGYELFEPSTWSRSSSSVCPLRTSGSPPRTSTTPPSSARRRRRPACPTSSCTAWKDRPAGLWSESRSTPRRRPS